MEYYREAVAALLKGYMLVQMSFMIATANNEQNYRERAEQLREQWIHTVSQIQDNAKLESRVANKTTWACDPDDFSPGKRYQCVWPRRCSKAKRFSFPDSFIQITHFYQGYVDNEINLNADDNCRSSCDDYTHTRHYTCVNKTFCAPEDPSLDPYVLQRVKSKAICHGDVRNCSRIAGDVRLCLAVSEAIFRVRSAKLILSLCSRAARRGGTTTSDWTATPSWRTKRTARRRWSRRRGCGGSWCAATASATATSPARRRTGTSACERSSPTSPRTSNRIHFADKSA